MGVEISYYVRDASGNIMSVYEQFFEFISGSTYKTILRRAEVPLYGSDRLGMYTPPLTDNLLSQNFAFTGTLPTFNLSSLTHATPQTMIATRQVGQKSYELKDHLGNIRAVITDRKDQNGNAEVFNASNYYPFGMQHSLNSSATRNYRFGYQGQFAEDEGEENGYNSFEARMYDSKIGRWTTIDPAKQYYSPYLANANNPLKVTDPDGRQNPWDQLNYYYWMAHNPAGAVMDQIGNYFDAAATTLGDIGLYGRTQFGNLISIFDYGFAKSELRIGTEFNYGIKTNSSFFSNLFDYYGNNTWSAPNVPMFKTIWNVQPFVSEKFTLNIPMTPLTFSNEIKSTTFTQNIYESKFGPGLGYLFIKSTNESSSFGARVDMETPKVFGGYFFNQRFELSKTIYDETTND